MAHRIIERAERDLLGEGLMWSSWRGAVFWVDILAPALYRLDLADDRVTRWPMPERVGWILERKGRDDFVIGLKSGFAALTLEPFGIVAIGDPEPDRPHNRLNDAAVDLHGRIWAGTMDDRHEVCSGALYCLDTDGRWTRHADDHAVTNGPAFSPDGRIMYHTDTGARRVDRYEMLNAGALSPPETFLVFDADWGAPDGMTCDRDGGLWIAHWGGSRISRFRPDGILDRSIALPAKNVTNVTFAGAELNRMFVTSAACEDPAEMHAGALFEVLDHGAVGCPHRQYLG